MFSPDSDAHNAVLLSLAGDLFALLAFLASLWAITISRTVARRTTEPILTLRINSPLYMGYIELQNTGAVRATSIRIELIEIRNRASALLHVDDSLTMGDSCKVLAHDFPDELNAEFRDQHLEDANTAILGFNRAINNDLNPVEIPHDQMAFHLLTRQGDQRIIISCAVPDKPRQQRIYKVYDISDLRTCSTFLVRYRADYLRFRYKRNARLRPTPEMPELLGTESEER